VRNQLSGIRRIGWIVGVCCGSISLFAAFACSSPNRLWSGRGDAANSQHPKSFGYMWREKEFPAVQASIPKIANAEPVNDDELCMTCHEAYAKHHKTDIHRAQSCEKCHGPGSLHIKSRGKEPGTILSFKTMKPAERSEVCLQCHSQDACAPGARWRTSTHANAGVSCTDCHKAHYTVPPGTAPTQVGMNNAAPNPIRLAAEEKPNKDKEEAEMVAIRAASHKLGAANPQTCLTCHKDKSELLRVAHPHQIGGKNNFVCTTCHDPHGKIKAETRKDLCLNCHKGHPTMAWQSSIHNLSGVACVDCHNPHPSNQVLRAVDINHDVVNRPKRLPMSVDQPGACYKCHQQIMALFEMPSHHPVREGKMVCTDCHDTHGAAKDNLKEATLNMVCYNCHTEKRGPFVYRHPPVEENCAICHNPHGTVANNLLKQPTAFLCLRCHSGHRGFRHAPIDTVPALRQVFYTNCAQCHAQIHGTNLPSQTHGGQFTR
jgi:DmsE family decaheme c-type cytochrome